jgi:uncharacterized integral membrane protein
MRYFFYISHILCYEQSIKKSNDEFVLIKSLYKDSSKAEENKRFFERALDCWYSVMQEYGNIEAFFDKYLSQSKYEKKKVATYKTIPEYTFSSDRETQNFFLACIKLYQVNNNFSYGDFLFLYGIITYLLNKEKIAEKDFITRLRILRNLIWNSNSGEIRGDADYMRDHGINVKTSTKLTTATRNESTSVVYMAFDGVPRLGFILSCRVGQSFKRIPQKAAENNFEVYVETYEPYLNNKLIERIGAKEQVEFKILKTQCCDPNKQKRSEMCDGSIVSVNSAKSIVTAIGGCRDIVKQRRNNALIDILVAIFGTIMSVVFAVIACFNDALAFLGWIDSHLSILLIMITVLGILPGMISSFIFKKKKDIRHQSSNGDQNSNERKA